EIDLVERLLPAGGGDQPEGEQRHAGIIGDAGGAVEDGHRHGDGPAIDLQMRRYWAGSDRHGANPGPCAAARGRGSLEWFEGSSAQSSRNQSPAPPRTCYFRRVPHFVRLPHTMFGMCPWGKGRKQGLSCSALFLRH